MTEVRITEYQDVFAIWCGLQDGTLTALDDPTGKMWIKYLDETMTLQEWNRRSNEEDSDS